MEPYTPEDFERAPMTRSRYGWQYGRYVIPGLVILGVIAWLVFGG